MTEDYGKQGNAFLAAGDLGNAESRYRMAIAVAPESAGAHVALGFVLHQQGRLDEARRSLEKALSIDPREADGRFLLGRIAWRQNRGEDAVREFGRAIDINPDFAEALRCRGVALRAAHRFDEALRDFDRALALQPDFPECRLNKALVLLARGEFAEGLELFESRIGLFATKQHSDWLAYLSAHPEKPRWRGESLAGRRILVWMDEGLGDCVMTMRYLPKVAERGAAKILVLADPLLARVVENLPVATQVVADVARVSLDAFDVHCTMTSLPWVFGTRSDTIPAAVPYLRVPPEMRASWSARLSGCRSPKVGLVWSGSKDYGRDALRSLSLERLEPLVRIAAGFVSLQKGEAARELGGRNAPILDCMDECADFLDTAALVQNLDLVIGVDTSVAHLAGALGKPVWLLNRFESEWRWGLDREDSPWYPTMRIFNQPCPGDWESVVASVARHLARFAAR